MVRLSSVLLLLALACLGCSESGAQPGADPAQVNAMEAPRNHACRDLTKADLEQPTNATRTVSCSAPHNAQTYASGDLPEEFDDVELDDTSLGEWAYDKCSNALEKHLGATESALMRSMISWVWYSPSEDAWDDGARWYRCDLVGGGRGGAVQTDLPTDTKNLFRSKHVDDRWMVCARGKDVNGVKVPCSKPHTWRAVTTIKLGEPADEYPGKQAVVEKTSSYCEESVNAWLGYPDSYDYGYTWFGADDWKAGNRLSVCWARTDK